jgi:hypothetical protein
MDYENIKIFFIGLTAFVFALIAYILLLWNYYKKRNKKLMSEKALIEEKFRHLDETLKLKFTNIHGTIMANNDMQMIKLENIDNKVEKINGDVRKLKEVTTNTKHDVDKLKIKTEKHDEKIERYGKQTKKARFFESNPIIFLLVIVGLFAAINHRQLIEWIKLIF